MDRIGAHGAALVLLLVGTAACGSERAAEGEATAGVEAEGMDPRRLAELIERYPVLGEERAPAPRPSPGATPATVPERYREALPPRALRAATGEATFYADEFEGRRTASGIPFRQNQMVAAHRGFPFGTLLRVTNLRNDRAVNVRVVDRGPFGGESGAPPAIIDLSRRAATKLGYTDSGRTRVRVEVLEWGEGLPRAS